MSPSTPAVSFNELFAYTDYLAQRWLKYFRENPAALDIEIGAKTGKMRNLVQHIVQVEQYFSTLLLGNPVRENLTSPTLDDLAAIHKTAHEALLKYVASASESDLQQTHSLGFVSNVSSRKALTQVALHGVHHWAQVAMEVRQAGFPTGQPQDFILTNIME